MAGRHAGRPGRRRYTRGTTVHPRGWRRGAAAPRHTPALQPARHTRAGQASHAAHTNHRGVGQRSHTATQHGSGAPRAHTTSTLGVTWAEAPRVVRRRPKSARIWGRSTLKARRGTRRATGHGARGRAGRVDLIGHVGRCAPAQSDPPITFTRKYPGPPPRGYTAAPTARSVVKCGNFCIARGTRKRAPKNGGTPRRTVARTATHPTPPASAAAPGVGATQWRARRGHA